VVLTFDDGPLPGPTNRVLAALARECARATFFLIGRNAAANPALVRRIAAEGHTIANHTYAHTWTLRRLSEAGARAEIERGFSTIDAALGRPAARFFRYPGFGDRADTNAWLARQGIAVFGTDVWASDWTGMSAEAQLALVLARLERTGGGIVLFHDTRPQTAAMLPAFLRALKARGFSLAHVVQGGGRPGLRGAGPRWASETEAILRRTGHPPPR
jgi:peptidoglycan/xylan/chitin deacetylase (PgdA/CDA1 family)